jgi:N-acetylmuramoyl-L-alanine amidase
MTRTEGPAGADYEAGLYFRAQLANLAGAHALVSIHNNAGSTLRLDSPGTETYYQSQLEPSRRFGALVYEELFRGMETFEANWVGGTQLGAKSRVRADDPDRQLYGILRMTEMPAVIAEGLYLSNRSEEALLNTPEVRQAYAESVYRALVRFLTTDDDPRELSFDPEVWAGFPGSGAARPECVIPAQPED